MSTLDRAMVVVSVLKLMADGWVMIAGHDWHDMLSRASPVVSALQLAWVVSALRRSSQRGPYGPHGRQLGHDGEPR